MRMGVEKMDKVEIATVMAEASILERMTMVAMTSTAQAALPIAILLRGCPRGCQVVIEVAAMAQAAMLVRMEMAALTMVTTQAALQIAMPTLRE